MAGTTTAEAAEALTKAIAFEGGTLVTGLLPASTESDVSLLPSSTDSLELNTTALMSFDVRPVDASVQAALIHFSGASSHIEVTSKGFVDAADGGTGPGESGEITLSYELDDAVCTDLCDRKYAIKVVQAVSLAKDKVSKHASFTLTLDCREAGNHDRCGKGDSDGDTERDSGQEQVADAGGNPALDSGREPLDAGAGRNDSGTPGTGGDGGAAGRADAAVVEPCALEVCAGDFGEPDQCVDTLTNAMHCGGCAPNSAAGLGPNCFLRPTGFQPACSTGCTSASECNTMGECTGNSRGDTACAEPSNTDFIYCTDLAEDAFCGSCDTRCAPEESCASGVCVPRTCPSGERPCGYFCRANELSCGEQCQNGASCNEGSCAQM